MKHRCKNCKKLLAIGAGKFEIRCPRCKAVNTICSLTTRNTPKLSDNRLEHRECRFTFDIQETK